MTTPAGRRAFHLDEATSILARTPGLLRTMLDGLPEHWLTTNEGTGTWAPRDVVGRDEVLVGRVRKDLLSNRLWLWQVSDNLRKGAATNAVQIAELLLERDLIGRS